MERKWNKSVNTGAHSAFLGEGLVRRDSYFKGPFTDSKVLCLLYSKRKRSQILPRQCGSHLMDINEILI